LVDQIIIDIVAYGHVLAAMGWLGGGILTGFVIGPNLRSLSPGSGLEFNAKVLPKINRFMQATIGSTLLFGVLLFLVAGPFTTDQFNELSFGIAVAVVIAVIAFAYVLPAFSRVAKIASEAVTSGQPPSPDIMKYAKRARQGAMLGVLLLLVVLATMVASGFS
jgi:uncharacterized membrane protein